MDYCATYDPIGGTCTHSRRCATDRAIEAEAKAKGIEPRAFPKNKTFVVESWPSWYDVAADRPSHRTYHATLDEAQAVYDTLTDSPRELIEKNVGVKAQDNAPWDYSHFYGSAAY